RQVLASNDLDQSANVVVVEVGAKYRPKIGVAPAQKKFEHGSGVRTRTAVNQHPVGTRILPLGNDNAVRIAEGEHIYFNTVAHPDSCTLPVPLGVANAAKLTQADLVRHYTAVDETRYIVPCGICPTRSCGRTGQGNPAGFAVSKFRGWRSCDRGATSTR